MIYLLAASAGIAALAGAGVGIRLLTIDTYSNELPPQLEFEIRLPATMSLADRDAVSVELHTDRNVGDGTLFDPWPRPDGVYQVLEGSVALAFKRLDDSASSSCRAGADQPVTAPADDPVMLRYRVRRAGEE